MAGSADKYLAALLSTNCTNQDEAWQAAIGSGIAALAVHLVISQLVKRGLLGSVVAKDSGFAAHQFVSMAYMVTLFVVGGSRWTAEGGIPATAEARVFDMDGTSRWLAAITFGQLL